MPTEEKDKHNEYNDDKELSVKDNDGNNTNTDEDGKKNNKTELDRLYEDAEDEIEENNDEIGKIEEESEESAKEYNEALIKERATKAKYTITALEKFKRKIHDFNEQQKVNAIYQSNKAEEAIKQEQQQEMGMVSRHYKETAQRLSTLEKQGMGNPFVDSEYLSKVAEMIEKRLQDEQKQFEEDKKQGEIRMDVAKKLNDDRVERRTMEDRDKEKKRDKLLQKIHKTQDKKTNELQQQKEKLKNLEQKNKEVNATFAEDKEDILSKMEKERKEKNSNNININKLANNKKDSNNVASLMNSLKEMEKMKNKHKEGQNHQFKIENIDEQQNENYANANISTDVKYSKSNDKNDGLSM